MLKNVFIFFVVEHSFTLWSFLLRCTGNSYVLCISTWIIVIHRWRWNIFQNRSHITTVITYCRERNRLYRFLLHKNSAPPKISEQNRLRNKTCWYEGVSAIWTELRPLSWCGVAPPPPPPPPKKKKKKKTQTNKKTKQNKPHHHFDFLTLNNSQPTTLKYLMHTATWEIYYNVPQPSYQDESAVSTVRRSCRWDHIRYPLCDYLPVQSVEFQLKWFYFCFEREKTE